VLRFESAPTAQSPEVLSDLRQVAVVESTESSNRLEGVVVAAHRLKSLVLKNATPQSRSEQEVAGYRDALGLIHESGEKMPFSEGTVLQLHGILYRYMPQPGGHWKATCPRRSKSEPLCRSNIEPGLVSDQRLVSCG
jgi:Fic family protein